MAGRRFLDGSRRNIACDIMPAARLSRMLIIEFAGTSISMQ